LLFCFPLLGLIDPFQESALQILVDGVVARADRGGAVAAMLISALSLSPP
jgi:hypothetical protein